MKHAPFGILLCGFACWLVTPAGARADSASLEFRAGSVVVKASAAAPAAAAAPTDTVEADPFVPDVYPSLAEAVRALGGHVGRAVAGSAAGEGVRVRTDCPCDDTYQAYVQGLLAAAPRARADRGIPPARGATPPPGEAWVTLSALSAPASSDKSVRPDFTGDAGTATVTPAGVGDGVSLPPGPISTRFVEKAWLANYSQFVGTRRDGRWVVGRSDPLRAAITAADAVRDARQAATDEVLRLVRARVPQSVRDDHGRLRDAVQSSLVGGDRLVVDRFPQKFERPYGTIYREAVLVDASDARLAPLVNELVGAAHQHRESRVHMAFSAAAVLLVTYALYRFANAFTRGYFTWSLRTAAAVFAAAAVMLIAAVA